LALFRFYQKVIAKFEGLHTIIAFEFLFCTFHFLLFHIPILISVQFQKCLCKFYNRKFCLEI